MIKKLIVTITSIMLCIGISGCTSEDSNNLESYYDKEKDKYIFRLVHEESPISLQAEYAYKFAELIDEKSNGKIGIEIYPVNQIGDALQQAELLQNGGVDFAIMSPGNIGTLVPESNIFSLHFLFTDDMETNMKILKESKAINELLSERYLEKDIKVLSYWQEGFQQWTSNKELNSPDAFKNLKIRTMQSPILLASYEAYGANPTPMPYMEVYSGLQLKMIDAQENPLSAIEEMKFTEVQDYLTLSNPSLYVATTCTNPEFFDGLPKELQDLILEVVDEMHYESYLIEQNLNNNALEKMLDSTDVELKELTEEERVAFKEKSSYAYEKYIKMYGEHAEAILELLIEEVEDINNN